MMSNFYYSNNHILALAKNHYIQTSGIDFVKQNALSNDAIINFQSFWNNLVLDQYMADGGKYRYRRYGEFFLNVSANSLELQPHKSYSQPLYINQLNGGVERMFEPLQNKFTENSILISILNDFGNLFKAVSDINKWSVRLHPYRIYANRDSKGYPTPEGLHRDGVDFIISLMINRVNIMGGISKVTNLEKNLLSEVQLSDPFDTLIGNDHLTLHEVSTITPVNDGLPAYRDVLVIAFTEIKEDV